MSNRADNHHHLGWPVLLVLSLLLLLLLLCMAMYFPSWPRQPLVTAVACVCQPGQYLTIRPDTTFHSQPFRPLLISPAIQLAVALLASIDPATPRTIPYLVPCMDNPHFHPPHDTHRLDSARSKLAQTPPVGLVSPRIQAVLSALHVGSGCSGAWNCSLQSILMLSDAT